jgi:acetate kinase
MTETILVVNSGSSSIKFELFSATARNGLHASLKGQIEGVRTRPRLVARDGDGNWLAEKTWPASEIDNIPKAWGQAVAFLRSQMDGRLPAAIGHRVVHGGPTYSSPTIVDDLVLDQLEKYAPFAPLHQHNNLAPIRAARLQYPALMQVACFDTAFHRTHSEIADRYAIPEQLYAEGVRRYGFHGLSYEYVAGRLAEIAPDIANGRVVIAHLGSGASMCALVAGRSVDSTMGFTTLDGLPMGTRPGQLDAGVVLYLMNEKQMSSAEIEQLLYNECGLKALSGISNDARDLLESTSPRAKLAISYLTYRIALFTALLAAGMGGIDGLVFTAGIGENAPAIREDVAHRLSWLGLELDASANRANQTKISCERSPIACFVIPTDEGSMIARHTLNILRGRQIRPLKEQFA